MYQRCFDSAAETIFEQDKTPRFSRFVISDDPNWESGHHMHDNETELIYVKKGIARLIIDSSLYVAHADDIVVVERGRLHAVASDSNSPATTLWVLFSRLGRKPTIAESFLSGGFRGSGERGH